MNADVRNDFMDLCNSCLISPPCCIIPINLPSRCPQRQPCNDHTIRQLQRIRECDSATIDPHKLGYIPYPAGGNLYRNGDLKNLTTYAASYIGGTQSLRPQEPSVAIYGLEGSKPGAKAAVFLSHQVIRPSVSDYGKISRNWMRPKYPLLRL